MAPGLVGPLKPVPPPPATPPLHGLVVSSRPIDETDDRWMGGVEFLPETCMHVFSWSPYCSISGGGGSITGRAFEHDPEQAGGLVRGLPFGLYTRFKCATPGMLSRDDKGRVLRALEAGTSKGLEEEFWSDTLGLDVLGQFSLTKSTPPTAATEWSGVVWPTAVKPIIGLALLGHALAGAGTGGRGMIHAPDLLVELWTAAGYLADEGKRLVTKVRGDVVVAGSGYAGTGPVGHANATPTPGTMWAYATSMVETRVETEIKILPDQLAQAIDREHNDVAYIAQRQVLATNDGCRAFAVLIDWAS